VFEELCSPWQVVEIVEVNPHTPVLGPIPCFTKMKEFLVYFKQTKRERYGNNISLSQFKLSRPYCEKPIRKRQEIYQREERNSITLKTLL
jgi:hypothetical protein